MKQKTIEFDALEAEDVYEEILYWLCNHQDVTWDGYEVIERRGRYFGTIYLVGDAA